jgi:nitrogen fixation protein FixH
MANSTSANLKLTVQATGENSGTWGQITNTNLLILEQAIGGYSGLTVNNTLGNTLTFTNGALSNGKDQVIKLTGTNRR